MGVVHRDLKPENILIVKPVRDPGSPEEPGDGYSRAAGTDIVKLTDFGIAKIIDAPPLTFSEHLFGTPGYIAPECVEGTPVDRRTDVYSLGVVLYEMLTGSLPFDARGADLLTAPFTSAPIPPSARTKGILPELESLVLQMLSRNMDDRPADAFVVQEVLADLRDARAVPAGSRSARARPCRGTLRRRSSSLNLRISRTNRALRRG